MTEDILDIDASFGLDPHVLPQFDLLVADGRITREFADKVIAERCAAGLPMTLSDLQPRPAPRIQALSWVADFGGPEICSDDHTQGTIEVAGLEWSWYIYTHTSAAGLTCHLHDSEGKHTGWLELSQSYTKKDLIWKHTKILDRRPAVTAHQHDLKTVSTGGHSTNFYSAIEDVMGWVFQTKDFAGHVWYRTEKGRWAVPAWEYGNALEVFSLQDPIERDGRTQSCVWKSKPTCLHDFMQTVGIQDLSGFASCDEEGMTAAVGAVDKVIGAAKALVGDVDAFSAGKAAGRAEMKLEISRLA
jgi:hypothetical protein